MFRPHILAVTSAFYVVAPCAAASPDHRPGTTIRVHLAAEDTIIVRVPVAEEFASDKNPYRIDNDGFVNLPLVGRWRAAGLNLKRLETELADRLKSYYLDPQVSVSVAELHTAPVSILGAVNTPGLQRMTGRDTISGEALSRAGGLRNDAGETLTVTRRIEYGRIPLAEAKDDATGKFSVVELDVAPITAGERPEDNIALQPHDIVTVSRARMVYVLGDVTRYWRIRNQRQARNLRFESPRAGWRDRLQCRSGEGANSAAGPRDGATAGHSCQPYQHDEEQGAGHRVAA